MTERILYIGKELSVFHWLVDQGETVVHTTEPLLPQDVDAMGVTFLICYNHPYIVKKDVLDRFDPDKRVNLHISYLPWNRGADPNFWSWLDSTPKGISIHCMDEGIDTGDVIVRMEWLTFTGRETFRSTYQTLHTAMRTLFKWYWVNIKTGNFDRMPQSSLSEKGSYHNEKDKEPYLHLLKDGWDTPVSVLRGAK